MKTIDNLRQYLPVVAISLVLLASTIDLSAQNRRNDDKKGKDRDRKEYRQPHPHRYDDSRTANREWRDRKDNDRDRYYYHPKYSKKYKHAQVHHYDHPRYGRVYNKFDRNPVVFRHDHGNYYYYGNRFYTYHKGVGYCVTEPPRHVYFRHLPADCSRVHVNGQVFFRNGDLFFQLSPRGYAIVTSPVQVNLSFGF